MGAVAPRTIDDLHRLIRSAKEGRGEPVVVRMMDERRLRLYIGYNSGENRRLLKEICGRRTRPEWTGTCWLVARVHLDRLIDVLSDEYSELWLVREHNPAEKCAPACRRAVGHHCGCACEGRNHGIDDARGWKDISETFSIRHHGRRLSLRRFST
jgi:hypothetical protein